MYSNIDTLLEDWGSNKKLKELVQENELYEPKQLVELTYNHIKKGNRFVEERLKEDIQTTIKPWLEQYAKKENEAYRITSASQRRQ